MVLNSTVQQSKQLQLIFYIAFFIFYFSGVVTGLLKIGIKSLYVFDANGDTQMVNAPCVLDFYIHESRQRAGLGKILFQSMLQQENYQPEKLAIDRPSEKLVGFLRKHYGSYIFFWFFFGFLNLFNYILNRIERHHTTNE